MEISEELREKRREAGRKGGRIGGKAKVKSGFAMMDKERHKQVSSLGGKNGKRT